MAARKQAIPAPALVLGAGGLIPFVTTAFSLCLPAVVADLLGSKFTVAQIQYAATVALGAYGAVILSFLGGIRWGQLLDNKTRVRLWGPLTLSVVPSLIAWISLLFAPIWMLSMLAAGLVLQYALDIEAIKRGELPAWFGRLRTILTTGAVLSLLTGLVAHAL